MVYRRLSNKKLNNSPQGWYDSFLKGRVSDLGGPRGARPKSNFLFGFTKLSEIIIDYRQASGVDLQCENPGSAIKQLSFSISR